MSRKQRSPWERLPKESDPAWEAFRTYRDMPYETGTKRSLSKVAQRLNKSKTILGRWSGRYEWVKRVEEYDTYRDDLEIEERVKKQRERIDQEEKMDERHAALGVQLQRILLDKIKAVQDGEEISIRDLTELTRAANSAADLERKSRHATNTDKQLELNREQFEYKKEQDAGLNAEYEDLDETEAEIYGNDDEDT